MRSALDWQKPYRWAAKPGLIDPRWAWVWRGLRWYSPFWEGGGIRYQNMVVPSEWFQGDATPPSWGQSRRGMALTFDGSNDSGNSGAAVDMLGVNKMTLALLLDFPTTSAATKVLLESSTNYNNNGGAFIVDNESGTTLQFSLHAPSGSVYNIWTMNQSTGPHLYLFTVDASLTSGIVTGYVDGVQSGSRTTNGNASGTIGNYTWYLGARANAQFFWDRPVVALWAWTRLLTTAEIVTFSSDPFAAFKLRLEYTAGGITEYITPTGSSTLAGAIIYKPKTIWTGGITPPGSIINKISTIYSGSDTPSGITTKKPLTSYAGSISTSASLVSKVSSILSGTIATAASIIYKVGNVIAGTVSSIGSILWKGSVSYTGSGSTSGSVAKKPSVSYAGSIATSAIDVLKASKSFVGSIASSSTIVYKVGKAISGVISLSASIISKVSHILSGIVSSVGSLTNNAGETISLIVGGTVSLAGDITRNASHILSGVITSSNNIAHKCQTILSSSMSIAGSLSNSSILLRLKNFVLSFPLRAITCFVFRRNYVSIAPTVTHTMTLETHDKSLVLLVPSRSITVIVRGDNQ